MKLILKTQYESVWIKDPFGPNTIWMKTVPQSMYAHLYNHGFKEFFEEEVKQTFEEKLAQKAQERSPNIEVKNNVKDK